MVESLFVAENIAKIKNILSLELAEKKNLERPEDEVLSFACYENEYYVGGIVGKIEFATAFIDLLGVSKKYRAKGIGKKLLRHFENECLNKKVEKIYLHTQDFQALPFYLKHGYKVFAKLENVPFKGTVRYYLIKSLF
ncbi:MAG: GNAT family N-acetyltransferase [Enterococcus cecorum]|uniref:GNAT family N-acetyltransferase n=1 Tax=Enterococcus cecorum TaxID=44008 RepID=UPI0022DC4095|nr:GNAT family N-acetyltransferase [Enterococcus cecorum]CAI3486551.1 GNAT family N-acetyltransferase [Enterococcus cecorum]